MFEKVNPSHPDKVADRIAGAIVDLAYELQDNPKVAVEVLLGHGNSLVIIETSVDFQKEDIAMIVERLAPGTRCYIDIHPQDVHLAGNQSDKLRCGDNGIFKGMPLTQEQMELSRIARQIYENYSFDGKYILDGVRLVICQSHAEKEKLQKVYPGAEINPLGNWTGGLSVDSGATNRKLGSDMADSVTGGGLHGKDLSKADVSVNIFTFLEAQRTGKPVELVCAIGDESVGGRPYAEIVEIARTYIKELGGFEKFAEWGWYKWER